MITTYSTLDRTSSYLILRLADLRINARLFGRDAMSQLETDSLDIADVVRHEGRRLGVNKLVIAGWAAACRLFFRLPGISWAARRSS